MSAGWLDWARLRRHTSWLLGASVATGALALLNSVALGRLAGQTLLGQYAFLAAALAVVSEWVEFGIGPLLVREVAREPARAGPLLRGALALKAGLALLAGAALALVGWLAPFQVPLPALGLAGVAAAAWAWSAASTFEAAFRAYGQMGKVALSQAAGMALQVAGCIVLAWRGAGIVALAGWIAAARLGQLGLAGALYGRGGKAGKTEHPLRQRRGRAGPQGDRIPLLTGQKPTQVGCESGSPLRAGLKALSRELLAPRGEAGEQYQPIIERPAALLRQGAPFALAALAGAVYLRSDMLLVPWLRPAEAGSYAAARSLIAMFHLVPNAVCGALYPLVVQRAHAGSSEEARREQRRLAGWMLLGGTALAGVAWVLAGPLLGLFYGPAFAAALGPLRAQAGSLLPLMLNGLAMLLLYATGRPRLVSRALLLGALFKLGLGVVWIGRQGSMGAAWSVVVAEVVLCLLYSPLWLELFGGNWTRTSADARG